MERCPLKEESQQLGLTRRRETTLLVRDVADPDDHAFFIGRSKQPHVRPKFLLHIELVQRLGWLDGYLQRATYTFRGNMIKLRINFTLLADVAACHLHLLF